MIEVKFIEMLITVSHDL